MWGDSAYQGQSEGHTQARTEGHRFHPSTLPLQERGRRVQRAKNKAKSSVRAKVEHPFLVIKRLFGFVKTRYKGLAKDAIGRSSPVRLRTSTCCACGCGDWRCSAPAYAKGSKKWPPER